MASNFDNAAPFYDRLSKLVYGNALVQSQLYLLQFVPANSAVLIVGGGTGWILTELTKIYPQGLRITYVEISTRMTALSKQRKFGSNHVDFVNDDICNFRSPQTYDVVITPFLFDNFTDDSAERIFNAIHAQLSLEGLWLCTDFQVTGRAWQWVLLKTMYVFFMVLCGIETQKIPNYTQFFDQKRYQLLSSQTFYGNFIVSKQLEKSASYS